MPKDNLPTTPAEVNLDEVARALLDPSVKLSIPEVDSSDAQRSIIEQILASADPLAETTSLGGKQLVGVSLRCHDVKWHNSSFDGPGSTSIFAVMFCTLEDGSEVVVTSGGANVLTQLFRLVRDSRIGKGVACDVTFTEKDTNTAGRKVLWLKAAKFEEGADPLRVKDSF